MPLTPPAFSPFPLGTTTPSGWFLKQLTLQAEGLSGHLAHFWPDVQSSIWIGGSGDGGLHARAPYWLNGIVPLAVLLKNARGHARLSPMSGIYKAADRNSFLATDDSAARAWHGAQLKSVDVMAQAERYISYILAFQNQTTGWLGPDDDLIRADAPWARSIIVLALVQYAEAFPARHAEICRAVRGYLLGLRTRLDAVPLSDWSQARWQDIALGVQWLLEHAPQGHESELRELLLKLQTQGIDWESIFDSQGFLEQKETMLRHNVNLAQAIKSAAVSYRTTRNESLRALSRKRVATLDACCGLPHGMYVGDELIAPSHSPARGSELCGVVEAMFSHAVAFGVFGEVASRDRTERIAYNALPATWASPRGGDMWAHQYLQAVNQITAKKQHPHVWTHDRDDAERFGLEPNFGCCTANFNQGWPKLAGHIFWRATGGGVAVGIFAPASLVLPNQTETGGGGSLRVVTDYPFEDEIEIIAQIEKPMQLYVRVPGWADKAELAMTFDGSAPVRELLHAKNGTFVRVQALPPSTRVTLKLRPTTRLEQWAKGGGYSVHRGALMFSLPIAPNFTVAAHHFGDQTMSNDYDTTAASAWRFALAANPSRPAPFFQVTRHGLRPDGAPFNHSGYTVVLHARVRPLPSWGGTLGSAAEPPHSPACLASGACGEVQKVQLVPHGATDLRVGMFPLASHPTGASNKINEAELINGEARIGHVDVALT